MNDITLSPHELQVALTKAAELGARRALIASGLENPTIKRPEAIKLYGQANIDRWKKEGLLKPIQDGFKAGYRYSVIELESIAKTCNRTCYTTVIRRRERK